MQLDTIKAMERLARHDESVISLGQGIPSGNLDGILQRAAMRVIRDGIADAYSDPQGVLQLRQSISEQTAGERLNYGANETLVTVGAIEAINIALRSAIALTRKEIIIPTPSYSAYFALVEQAGGIVRPLPLNEAAGWALSASKLEKLVTKQTAAILLCNPNNPTGAVHDAPTLRAVAAIAKAVDIPLIIDEVYRHIIYDDDFYSPAEESEYHDTIIRVMSFSKDFNMTGWRVGYLQTAAARVPELTAIHDSLVNCTPVISQYVAMAALEESARIFALNRQLYNERREQMQMWLDIVTGVMDYMIPAGGYFFFPRLASGMSSQKAAQEFARHGLVTVPGSAFGSGGEGHVRLCFGRSGKAIHQGMQRLVHYYQTK